MSKRALFAYSACANSFLYSKGIDGHHDFGRDGRMIKEVRLKIGIDTITMAKMLSVSQSEYENIECNIENANAYLCYRICSILGINFNLI